MTYLRHTVAAVLMGLAAMVIVLSPLPGRCAELKPGEVINNSNADKIKDYVSPGVLYRVRRGMVMDIVPSARVDWPPPYKEATEKYSSQVRLTPDHRSLLGYVAGQPFPLLDPNDPNVAVKIMWNNAFRPFFTDDYDLRFFECEELYARLNGQRRVINDTQVGHYAGYNLVGRTEVEPMPIDPDFKKTNRLWLFALYPLISPEAERGSGIIRYRYADPARGDDSWNWNPGARRVRRLNESILSSNTGTHAFDPDHYSGFNPKTEQYDYKYIGDRNMLACVHAAHSPEVTCPYDSGASACPENWEMRHLYIVQATPRRSNTQAGNIIERDSIVYLDSELWFEPYVDEYDQSGQLWRNNVYWVAYRDRPVPDARVAIYPFKRVFVVGASENDVQSGFTSMCYLPGQHTPERECWYINMGAVDRDFCTIEAMVKAAP